MAGSVLEAARYALGGDDPVVGHHVLVLVGQDLGVELVMLMEEIGKVWLFFWIKAEAMRVLKLIGSNLAISTGGSMASQAPVSAQEIPRVMAAP